MAPEVLLLAVFRVAGSLPVLRWPLAGGLLAVLVDLLDLLIIDAFGLWPLLDYQAFDKWADQAYLALFLIVALRWQGIERSLAVGLYLFRLVGFVVFELTGDRDLLIFFPNLFEFWFLTVAAVQRFRPGHQWRPLALGVTLAALLAAKLVHEWALHVGRLFDGIGALEAIDRFVRWLLPGG